MQFSKIVFALTCYSLTINTSELENEKNQFNIIAHQALNMYYNREFDRALALYQKVIMLNPRYWIACFNNGLILLHYKNKPREALNYFKKALALNPTHPQTHFFIAKATQQLGLFDLALTHNKYASQLSETPDALAFLLYHHYHLTDAQKAFSFCHKEFPDKQFCSSILNALGKLMEKNQKMQDAITLYQQSKSLNQTNTKTQQLLRCAHYKHAHIDDNKPDLYQDILINGIVECSGNQDCAQRYAAIQNILNKYRRPITVLDLNPLQGYFSFCIARDYDATCIMTSLKPYLLELCKKNTDLNNLIVLKKRISLEDLERLSECEHFDLVLALDYVNWFESQWQEQLKAVFSLGDHVIIETPFVENDQLSKQYQNMIEEIILNNGGTLLHKTQLDRLHARMYHIASPKTTIIRTHWTRKNNTSEYQIESSYTHKVLRKFPDWKASPWHKGINLLTFKILNGCWPTTQVILEKLQGLKKIKHTDFNITNLIIQGSKLVAIDAADERILPKQDVAQAIEVITGHLNLPSERLYDLVT